MVDVVVIGAGLAGLSCARALQERGLSCRVLESSPTVGGRVATESLEGFLLDRGFQFLLTAYPEARRQLDYEALQLKTLHRDFLSFFNGKFHRLADPFRKPMESVCKALDSTSETDFSPDSRLPADATCSIEEIFKRPEVATAAHVKQRGIPERTVSRFLRPFFGALSLDAELNNSSRAFEFFCRMLADGDAAIPTHGMAQIPAQMAARIQHAEIVTNCKVSAVRSVHGQGSHGQNHEDLFQVQMNDEAVMARAVVIAANADERNRLVVRSRNRFPSKGSAANFDVQWNGVVTFYFAAERSPIGEPLLLLNGEGRQAGPVNHACVVSDISPAYAPAGASLICANVIADASFSARGAGALETPVREHLLKWFGADARRWRLLKMFAISKALPAQSSVTWERFDPRFCWHGPQDPFGRRPGNNGAGVYVCGDYLETASMQGALASGVRAAATVVQDLT